MPDGSFCHIIIPRNTVVFNKGKEALSISLKTTLIFNGQVGMVGSVCNHPFVELIYLLAKLLEVPFLESILFHTERFLDSLLTWHTQLNRESGATVVMHTSVCFLSKAYKSTRVAHIPSSEARPM